MKRGGLSLSAFVVVVWLSVLIAPCLALAAPQGRPKGDVKYVKRTAELEPPKEVMPSLRAVGGREEQIEPARN
jgi:hypothetical protein